ncbi:MAG: hypothetical protein ACFBSG_07265 [Leptolyngbyaceae cyanobacterium]
MPFIDIQKNNLTASIYCLLALIPAVFGFFFIRQYAVDLWFWDEWELIEFVADARESGPTLSTIVAQHNEHRIASLKVFSWLFSYFPGGWSAQSRMFVSYLVVLVTYGLLTGLILKQHTLLHAAAKSAASAHVWGLSVLLTGILLFSPVQFENWLWGFQIPWFLVNCLLVAAVFLLNEFFQNRHPWSFLGALGCCWVTSFSLAQGLIVWLACLPMFLTSQLTYKGRLQWTAVWLGSTAIAVCSYIWGYQKPGGHPSTNLVWQKPGVAIDYFLNQVGGTFGRVELPPVVTGPLLVLLYAGLTIWLFRQRQVLKDSALPWASIGLFTILCAWMITVGRMGFGAGVASRYTTVYLMLPIAVVNLLRLLVGSRTLAPQRLRLAVAIAFLLGFLVSSVVQGYENGLKDSEAMKLARYRGQACLAIYGSLEPAVADECIYSLVSPLPDLAVRVANEVQAQGIVAEPLIGQVKQEAHSSVTASVVDTVEISPEGFLRLTGWVYSNGHPGVVVLAWNDQRPFSYIVDVNQRRNDVAAAYSRDYLKSGWTVAISIGDIPQDASSIAVYFYDLERRALVKLEQVAIPQMNAGSQPI